MMTSQNPGAFDDQRTLSFRRNADLESLLDRLNSLLRPAEAECLMQSSDFGHRHTLIFVMGPLRSGTTLFMQWLASLGQFAYPTNLMSRFFAAPVIGALVQLLLTDPRYNFRNEILEFSSKLSFESENGKTQGALAPNEFWYFWRRFLPFHELDWAPDEVLRSVVDRDTLIAELTTLTRVFAKPFALKAMILNYNIPFLSELFEDALFIQLRRDPVANIASILQARTRQLGSEREWYSFKIPEYPLLKDLDPVEQSAGQCYYIDRAVSQGIAGLPARKALVIDYDDFCRDPSDIFCKLAERLGLTGEQGIYAGPRAFAPTKASIARRDAIEKALHRFW